MNDKPTIQQILSDPRSATDAALGYCNGEMTNCHKQSDELEAANRELKRQHVTVSDKLAHAQERIVELERREALLTANVIACERRRSYRAPKPPMSMNDAEVRAWSLEEAAIDLAMVNTYIALTEAGFPW